ncbi:MAG TPA: DUF1036 domain-containing protein [Rhizomicrobium sp.]|jgi:uncharacterized membrane protein|nr:DUF1036 domain-containing protein [Rhizomicrobium sp.]
MTLRARVLAALAFALGFAPVAGHASLTLCNRTSYVLYAATGAAVPGGVQTQGWARLVPGGCSTVLPGDLTAPSYYLYAKTAQAHAGPARAWGGNASICVKDTTFSNRDALNPSRCSSDDFYPLPFAPLDTHRMRSWTATFSEAQTLASLPDAQRAGLKRLLRDSGYRIGAIDGSADKAADGALADFRKKQKIAANATVAQVFDALETNAMKTATPAGYSICNDTAKAVAASLGQKERGDWISHGWWKIQAGGCAKVMPDLAGADSVYLFVQKINGPALVTGPNKFCVADIEFDIQGRDRCTNRGLTEQGFAETRVKGLAGFAAHVGETGLVKAPAPKKR